MNNYNQFSEVIDDIKPEEAAWIRSVLTEQGERLWELLGREEVLEGGWPDFGWALQDGGSRLWFYSGGEACVENLALFVKAFFKKFRPDGVFKVTGADWCSELMVGEFGGWWMVVTSDGVFGGDTWDEAGRVDRRLGRPGGGVDTGSRMRIRLPRYGVAFDVYTSAGSICSNLGQIFTDEADKRLVDTIESIVLGHARAGVDVESPAYAEGLEAVLDVHNREGENR